MKRLIPACCLTAILLSAVAASVVADDRIKLLSTGNVRSGNITSMTPDEVVINYSGVPTPIPVGDIDTLNYEGEPAQFTQARNMMAQVQYEDARTTLEKISPNSIGNPRIKTELEFLQAYIAAQIAIRGGDVSLAAAVAGLDAFNKKNKDNYRIYESVQLLGDLYMQMNKPKEALAQFSRLAVVESSPMVRVRGALGKASVLLDSGGQKSVAEAEALYKDVKNLVDTGEVKGQTELLRASYTLGLARCKAINGKPADAEKEVSALLPRIPAEDVAMNALAYNTLGAALKLQKNKTMDAIAAYLHTHLLYSTDPVLHRQALNELIGLYRNDIGDEARAVSLEAERRQRYGN